MEKRRNQGNNEPIIHNYKLHKITYKKSLKNCLTEITKISILGSSDGTSPINEGESKNVYYLFGC